MTANKNEIANIMAEKAFLGALMHTNGVYFKLHEIGLELNANMFANLLHGAVFEHACRLIEKGNTADPITLSNILKSDKRFGEFSEHETSLNSFIVDIAASAVTIINATSYARNIKDAYMRRELFDLAEKIANQAVDFNKPVKETVEEADQSLFSLSQPLNRRSDSSSLSDTVNETMNMLQKSHKSEGIIGLTTGLTQLDDLLGGLQDTDLIILGGRPGMGKTGLVTTIAKNAAKFLSKVEAGGVIGFWSLEMSKEQLTLRMMADEAKVDANAARKGDLSNEEMLKMMMAGQELKKLPIEIMDASDFTVSSIRAGARGLQRKYGLKLVIVDYLQLIKTQGRPSDNRTNDVSNITRGLKMLAKELGVPVIALSQLSRAVEQRDDKRPKLSDLRESGAIEQDADIVMFLYREAYYLMKEAENNDSYDLDDRLNEIKSKAELILAKYRHGPLSTINLTFTPENTSFSD